MQSIKANSVKVMHPHTVLTISVPARHFISDEQEIQESRGEKAKKKKSSQNTWLFVNLTTQHLNFIQLLFTVS